MSRKTYAGTASKTLLLSSFIVPIPWFEMYFIEVLEKVLEAYKLPEKLHIEALNLIREENTHSSMHIAINNRLASEGYNIEEIERLSKQYISRLRRRPLEYQLAYVSVMEVFVGEKAKIFTGNHGLINSMSKCDRAEIMNHLKDEISHYTVCLEIYKHIFGSKVTLLRCLTQHTIRTAIAYHSNIAILKDNEVKPSTKFLKDYFLYNWSPSNGLLLRNNLAIVKLLLK